MSTPLHKMGRIAKYLVPAWLWSYVRLSALQRRPPRLWRPQTFADFIARAMLCRTDPLMSITADKVALAEWVESVAGPGLMPERYQVVRHFDEFDLDRLPPAVVFKASHGSGMTIVVTGETSTSSPEVWDDRAITQNCRLEEADLRELASMTATWLRSDHSKRYGERHYGPIPRRLIAEEYLGSLEHPLVEIGFYCVNGHVVYAQICIERGAEHQVDRTYRELAISDVANVPRRGALPAKPAFFDEMVVLAEQLSRFFECTRVDLVRAGDRTLVQELSHTTYAGAVAYDPPEFSKVFGAYWRGCTTIPERFYATPRASRD